MTPPSPRTRPARKLQTEVPVVQEAAAEVAVWAAVVAEVAVEEDVAVEASDQPIDRNQIKNYQSLDATSIRRQSVLKEAFGWNANHTNYVQHLREQGITKRRRQGQDMLCRIKPGEWRKGRRYAGFAQPVYIQGCSFLFFPL